MSDNALLQSTSIIGDFRAGLAAFGSMTRAQLNEARETAKRFHWRLRDLEARVSQELARLEEYLENLQCAEDPDDYEIARVEAEIDEKSDLLRRIRMHLATIEDCMRQFFRESRQLDAMLDTDVSKAMTLLAQLHAHADRYGAAGSGSGGAATTSFASPTGSISPGASSSESLDDKFSREAEELFGSPAKEIENKWLGEYQVAAFNREVNQYMRNGQGMTSYDDRERTEIIAAMTKPFGQYRLSAPLTLYRGIPGNSETKWLFDNVAPGDMRRDRAFVSTSRSKSKAEDFRGPKGDGYTLTIRAVPNLTYIPLSHSGEHLNEAELLLPPGTQFYVIDAPPKSSNIEGRIDIEVIPLPPHASPPPTGVDPSTYAADRWGEYRHEIG
ncbi:MAG: ADP-ribosyltransferase [Thermomicrobiales bacterium]